MAEHSVARNQNFCSRAYYFRHRIERQPAVNFNPIIQAALSPQLSYFAQLMQRVGDERLRPESRSHRHDQHIIDDVQDLSQHFNRSSWIDRDARMAVMALDQIQRAIEVSASFEVHRNPIRPCIGKRRNVLVRVLDHQVAIERKLGGLA
jgi:hypothetical protein